MVFSMLGGKKVACVIPARLQSSRFPKKVLAHIRGKPLLQWVWEAAGKVSIFDEVVFAIDSDETAALVESFGGKYFMTSVNCPSGTDRLIELMKKGLVKADIWVNWQGDEPFISSQMIYTLLQTCDREESDVWTLKKRLQDWEDVLNPHIAKVVLDAKGYALYFSRLPIPYYRDPTKDEDKIFYKHIGLYAFTQEALQKISCLSPCYIEQAEQLEQMRFLYNNLRIRVHETKEEVIGIDLPEHLVQAEKLAYLL